MRAARAAVSCAGRDGRKKTRSEWDESSVLPSAAPARGRSLAGMQVQASMPVSLRSVQRNNATSHHRILLSTHAAHYAVSTTRQLCRLVKQRLDTTRTSKPHGTLGGPITTPLCVRSLRRPFCRRFQVSVTARGFHGAAPELALFAQDQSLKYPLHCQAVTEYRVEPRSTAEVSQTPPS